MFYQLKNKTTLADGSKQSANGNLEEIYDNLLDHQELTIVVFAVSELSRELYHGSSQSLLFFYMCDKSNTFFIQLGKFAGMLLNRPSTSLNVTSPYLTRTTNKYTQILTHTLFQ